MPKAANRSAGAARKANRAWFISNLDTVRRRSTMRITASSWPRAFVGRRNADRYDEWVGKCSALSIAFACALALLASGCRTSDAERAMKVHTHDRAAWMKETR